MLARQSQSPAYWKDNFRATRADVEYLFSLFLEEELPLTNREMALRLIQWRLTQEADAIRRVIERGQVYTPKQEYAIGQELLFPALGYASGTVVADRDGENPDYGPFRVVTVEFEDKKRRDFAAAFQADHKLNDAVSGDFGIDSEAHDVEAIFAESAESIIDEIEARLVEEDDAVYFGGRWFLRSLMADINVGHMHLAEAMLDIGGGGPIATADLVNDLELAKNIPQPLKEFSLDVALSEDERFDEVGPRGRVWWFLKRLEPADVTKPPEQIVYEPIPYQREQVRGELAQVEYDIDDEYSDLLPPAQPADQVTLTLIYPHRRAGTLPLTSRAAPLFPTADEASRVIFTFFDAQTQQEFKAWVVRDGRFVAGMGEYYRTHKLPIGAYVTLKRTDDPARLIIDFESHKARSEYIRLAIPQNNKLTFANFKRSIGAGYDDLLALGAEDIAGVDTIWQQTHRNKRVSLVDIMRDLMPELSKLNPQNAVHAKTLYSAVNVIRRCPPGPIFSALVTRPEFENAAGPYWRLSG